MHIVFITHEFPQEGYPHGGIGTFVKNITVELCKRGIRTTVLGMSKTDKDQTWTEDGTTIHLTADSTWPKFRFIQNWMRMNKKLKEIHAAHPIDFVEAPEIDLAWVHKIKGVQYVIRMNGGHRFFAYTSGRKTAFWRAFQEKRSFSRADRLIAVSHFVNNETARYLPFDPSKTAIIPNAIDIRKFSPDPTIQADENTLIFAGTLVEKKGIRQLILAMPKIREQFPDAVLHVYGRDGFVSGTKDSFKEFMLQHIPKQCFENVVFKGVAENTQLPKIIAAGFACVYPSHMEALPLAWLEAMSVGKPFVASKTGPGPEVVNHGVDGLLVDPYDPNDIAEKVTYLFQHRDEAKRMGEAARKRVVDNFDMEKVVDLNIKTFTSWMNK